MPHVTIRTYGPNQAIVTWLSDQRNSRIAVLLNLSEFCGAPAHPHGTAYFRKILRVPRTYPLLACGRSLVRNVIRHNLTCPR